MGPSESGSRGLEGGQARSTQRDPLLLCPQGSPLLNPGKEAFRTETSERAGEGRLSERTGEALDSVMSTPRTQI